MLTRTDALTILDEMDHFRRTHQDETKDPSDYCMRVLEAIVARAAGFTDRVAWTEELRRSNTRYTKYINGKDD